MKKHIALLIIAMLVVSPVLALNGEVMSVNGKVEMQDSRGVWRTVSVGDTIMAGTMISTGFRSEATIKLGASVISVKPLTRMTLNELTEKSDIVETDLYLEVGNIKAEVNPLDNKRNGFTVRSPVATASVRGTVFEIGDTVRISQGSVLYISAVGQSRIGNAGQQLALFDETVTGPITMLLQDLNPIRLSNLPSTEERSPIRASGPGSGPGVSKPTSPSGTTTMYFVID